MKKLFISFILICFLVSNAYAVVVGYSRTFGGGGADGFVGLDGVPTGTAVKPTNGASTVSWSSPYECTQTGAVNYIDVYWDGGSTALFNVGIYNEDGSTLLADSTAATIPGIGYLRYTLDSEITVTSGVSYRFAVGQSDAGNNPDIGYTSTVGGTWYGQNSAAMGDAMPATMQGTDGTLYSNFLMNIFAHNTP